MNNIYQTTLAKPVTFKGVGLHSGKISTLKILPTKANHGVVFKRVDIAKNNIVEANFKKVTSAKLCTTLENEFGVKVSTVEHLLAAFYIAGIDNVLVEIDNEEVPIMDGSAKDFLEILKKTEFEIFSEKRNFIKVLDKFEFKDGEKRISIEPGDDTLEVEFQLNYKNKVIGKQKNVINLNHDNTDGISTSRTFCLFKDVEKIKRAGLAKGGSLDNAIVVDEEKILNQGGLRNDKEFVNHKILDLVGDFMLSGCRIIGKVNCFEGGHLLTNMFLRKLFSHAHIKKFKKNEKLKVSEEISQKTQVKMAISA